MKGKSQITNHWWKYESPSQVVNSFKSRVEKAGGVVEAEGCLLERVLELKRRGIWDKASIVWLPHGYAEDKLFAIKGDVNADLSFSRNGTRYRRGPTYIERVPYNLVKHSEAVGTASSWVSLAGSVGFTLNGTTDPNGNMTATVIEKLTSACAMRSMSSGGGPEGFTVGTWNIKFWAKCLTQSEVRLILDFVDNPSTSVFITDEWAEYSVEMISGVSVANGFDFSATDGTFPIGGKLSITNIQITPYGNIDYFRTTDGFDVPALDYNDNCPSWSLEKASINLLKESGTFDNASWTKGNASIIPNAIMGPLGLTVADKLVDNATSSNHEVWQTVSSGLSLSAKSTVSIFAKAGERTQLRINNGHAGVTAFFNLSNGTIVSQTGTGAFIEDWGNGWYRCGMVETVVSTANTIYFMTASGGTSAYLGDGTSGLYIVGAQLEAGPYATSYIPTTSSTVGRITDAVNALIPERTNRWIYSEDLSNADWVKLGTSVSSNLITAPSGQLTADKIVETAAYTTPRISKTISTVAGKAYTASIYAKAAERSQIRIVAEGSGSLAGYFDLSNGTTLNIGSGATCKIEDVGNGWYRCSMRYTATLASSSVYFATAEGGFTVTGDATKGVYLWGCQFESGSLSPYLSTTTVPVHDGSVIGQTEGTLYFEGSSFNDGTAKGVLAISDRTANNRMVLDFNSAGELETFVYSGGAIQCVLQTNYQFVTGLMYRVAAVYDESGVRFYVNGEKIGEDNTVIIPACSGIGLDTGYNSTPMIGNIQGLIISPVALTDAQAVALTAP